MEIANGVHHFETGPFNWYLIEEGGRLTLVDAGFPGHYRAFRDGLRELGKTLKDVEAIVITHAHADHVGFAERVRKETNVPLYVHCDDLAKAGSVLQLPWIGLLSHAWRPYTATMLGVAVWNGVFAGEPIRQARPFHDGETLDVPGRPFMLHVPGHTPGESALFLPDRKVLISGDTLVTRNLFTGESGLPQLTSPQLNYDYKLASRSLDRMCELGSVTMLPGHGRPWSGLIGDAIKIARDTR